MKMLQTMSLTGSAMVIFYVVIKLCGRKVFTYSFYKKMLMLVMVFFLFPFPYFIYGYADLLKSIFPLEKWGLVKYLPNAEWGKPIENYIEYTETGQFRINHPGLYIFTLMCLVLMLVLLARYIYKSQKVRKSVTRNAEQVKWEGLNKHYVELKSSMKIRSKVGIRISETINSPITMGVFKPIIFLPKHMYDEKKMSFMLVHELNHIKQKDIFLTIICYVILMLNFYNPFAYYLLYEWKRVVELACDEKVMECMMDEERKKYGLLLVDMAEKEMFVQTTYSLGFGISRKKLITERVENVMNKRKMNGLKRVLAGWLMLAVTFVSSLTVFAYEPDVLLEVDKIYGESLDIIVLDDVANIEEIELGEESVMFKSEGYQKEMFYIDEEGNLVVEEIGENGASTMSICAHSYVDKKIAYHIKAGNGCTIKIYDAKICQKCGKIKSKTLYETRTYAKCSH